MTTQEPQKRDFMFGNKFRLTHGGAVGGKRSRLYVIWNGIKQRCLNPKSRAYKWYGGRGITMHSVWINDFASFENWANKNGYADNLQIDRKDNDAGYYPHNCAWTTSKSNNNNRSSCKFFQFKDGEFNISQAAKFYGLTKYQMRHRLVVMKLNPNEAVLYEK